MNSRETTRVRFVGYVVECALGGFQFTRPAICTPLHPSVHDLERSPAETSRIVARESGRASPVNLPNLHRHAVRDVLPNLPRLAVRDVLNTNLRFYIRYMGDLSTLPISQTLDRILQSSASGMMMCGGNLLPSSKFEFLCRPHHPSYRVGFFPGQMS